MTSARRVLVFIFALFCMHHTALAKISYSTLGQPDLASISLASRCANPNARFSFDNAGFDQYGPSGIAIDPRGRIFVTDFAGDRVLTWPDFTALTSCQPADAVIGVGDLDGPESIAIDTATGNLFVASTLSHAVIGFKPAAGAWTKFVTLGTPGASGSSASRFHFPRGLAVDSQSRLFVADDFNKRVLIFSAPFQDGEAATDSIGAFSNGGFASPKGLAIVGNTLFVADYDNNRVLRFTGPFDTPNQVYVATAIFKGLDHPVDVGFHPDGSLLVTDQFNRRIARYKDAAFSGNQSAPSSSFADNIGLEPLGVAADRDGNIYVADYQRFRVLIRKEPGIAKPVNVNLSAKAKALLKDLQQRPSRNADRVAIGQQLITWKYGKKTNAKAWYGDWLQLKQGGYPLPLIMGGETSDLMSYPGFAPNQDAFNELIRHGQAGNIVTLVWHPENPVAGGNFGTPIANADLKRMIDPATATGAAWKVQLDRAAAVLQQFKNAGVPVLFRPLHEQNGNFFWWGDKGQRGADLSARQKAWAAMWRHMVKYLTVTKGLDNLVFVFGTNQVNYDGVVPPLTYYPGGQWADAVSIDIYDEQLDLAGAKRGLQYYAALVGTGKPFGLAEFGQSYGNNGTGTSADQWDARTLAARIRDSYPRMAFAVSWYSSVEGGNAYVLALPDVSFTMQLLNDMLIDTQ
jgi:mannan endo-1,4-beta-mannosidase